MDYSRKSSSQTGGKGGGDMGFPRVLKRVKKNSRDQLKKKWNVHRSVHKENMRND